MHIIILADPIDNQNAGVHFYTKNLIENLLKIDKENHYTFIHQRKNEFFRNKDHHIIPKKNIPGYGTYRKFQLIPKLIKQLNPNLVFEPSHIGPFRLPKRIKRAVMIHDLTPILFPQFHIKRSTIIHKLLLKRVLKNADLILTASENTKKDIKQYEPRAKNIKVIPLGIDQNKTIHNSKNKITKDPYFLYLGTLEPRKNLQILIKSFIELKKEHHLPHKLILAGKIGWKSSSIVQKAKQHRDIILTGYLSEAEKESAYKNATIFIYPSIYEGFGLPPLEALSYGIPVIASKGGSLPEILKDHALLFDPTNKEELKKHILSLLNTPSNTDKGKEFAQSFSWQDTATKTLKAFTSCVQTSSDQQFSLDR